jgi:hypothetical protein
VKVGTTNSLRWSPRDANVIEAGEAEHRNDRGGKEKGKKRERSFETSPYLQHMRCSGCEDTVAV